MDAFLDVVETELARLIQENTDLLSRVESAAEQQLAAPVDTADNFRPLAAAVEGADLDQVCPTCRSKATGPV